MDIPLLKVSEIAQYGQAQAIDRKLIRMMVFRNKTLDYPLKS